MRHLANKCTCGYIKEDFTFDETTWQCPICGKIHDRDTLIKFNRGLDISYKPKETKQIVLNISKRLSNSLMTNTINV